ncbi:MAG: fibrobacter succinogenes major paralogous domain-containing protein [Culturomica sp.]|nr:fibrobacter succinogenes major paralogous domain-containing protein [Culturomica sp.]
MYGEILKRWMILYIEMRGLLGIYAGVLNYADSGFERVRYYFGNLREVTRKDKKVVKAGGNRNNSGGTFNNVGTNGNWWSSSENSSSNAWNRNLNYNEARVNRNTNNKSNGFSVRCLLGNDTLNL